jgi:predicted  nucleic acid-binding Zn-ribbon protein
MAANPVDNNIGDAIKSLEKLRGNTESYGDTWNSVGKKIQNAINPINKINKQIEESQKRQVGLQTKIGELEKKLLNNELARLAGINGLSDEENKLLDSTKKQLQTEIEIEKKKRIQQT